MAEAVAQFQKGLQLLAICRTRALHQQQELDLRVSSLPALIGTKGYSSQDVGETIAQARTLAEQLNKPEYIASLLYGRWVFNLVRAELKLALAGEPKKRREIGDEGKDHALGFQWPSGHGNVRFFLGELVSAQALFEQSESLVAHRQLYSKIIPDDPYLVMLAYLGATLCLRGYIDQGRAKIKEALSEGTPSKPRSYRWPWCFGSLLGLSGYCIHLVRSSCMQMSLYPSLRSTAFHCGPAGQCFIVDRRLADVGLRRRRHRAHLKRPADSRKESEQRYLGRLASCCLRRHTASLRSRKIAGELLDEASDTLGKRKSKTIYPTYTGSWRPASCYGERIEGERSYRHAIIVALGQTAKLAGASRRYEPRTSLARPGQTH